MRRRTKEAADAAVGLSEGAAATPSFPTSPSKQELEARRDSLLAQLDKAIQSRDVEAVYWLNVEIMSLYHIHGESSPLRGPLGTEVLKGLREIKFPNGATQSTDQDAEANKEMLKQALADFARLRSGKQRTI